jgi:bifunctional UDP-N-acetylglucosamine pyrophosphorylase/glucosamine-1-phosphate N-acetyltransferase
MERVEKPGRPISVVVLAAGAGTRMRSDRPKVLHEVGGASLLAHALGAAAALGPERTVLVVGHGGEAVAEAARAITPGIRIVEQAERLGTGHAVRCAAPALDGVEGDLVVLYADTPFIAPESLARMAAARDAGAGLVVLGFESADPGRYGRLVTEGDGTLLRIVEARDAGPGELAITTCNSGVMAGEAATMLRLLEHVGNDNAQGEYYLTDLVSLARAEGIGCRAVLCDEAETLGVNDRADLARAEAAFQARARRAAMLAGATLVAPETVFLSHDTRLGRDVTVEPNVVIGPGVEVADGARIAGFCHLEHCRIGPGATVGPFARLRGGTALGADCRVGNFVEMKNATLAAGVKAGHLTYVGDAAVGAGANLGAGTVTCNYDGVDKHRTEIGAHAFIGTHAALVAPVTVGEGAYVATGTVVTEDVPDEALAIARPRQTNREGLAARLRKTFAARKAARARSES